jgi:CBS domain-containing protein
MNVEEIARKDVVALRANETLDIAWRQMRDQSLDALPVQDTTGCLIGILTEHDLLARLVPRRASRWWSVIFGTTDQLAADYVKAVGVSVEEVMTVAPVTIGPDASIQEAAGLMRHRGVGTLPVVDDDAYIGIVTRADALDHLSWPAAAPPGTVEDIELESSIRESIEQEPWASRHPVTVEAFHGIIRLTGVVASPVERRALLAMARSCVGCAGVEDRLLVLSRPGRCHPAPGV